jgi:hypothetical protein
VVSVDCPQCGLVNPMSASSCDCGYDFASRRLTTKQNVGSRQQRDKWISQCLLIVVASSIVASLVVGFANGGQLERSLTNALVLGFPGIFALVTGMAMMLMRDTRTSGGFIFAAGLGLCLGVFLGFIHVYGLPS